MPILDPLLQISLLFCEKNDCSGSHKPFFLKYLKVASDNLYRDINTIEASIQFRKDLQNSIAFINNFFHCSLPENVNFNINIKNCYQYLYNIINKKHKKLRKKDDGNYFLLNSPIPKRYYRPCSNKYSKWFLTDSPIAILCINNYNYDGSFKIIDLINLEVDLMLASGFTLVLCIYWQIKKTNDFELLMKMISKHKFSEIHLNISNEKEEKSKETYENCIHSILNIIDIFDGYFYLYTLFANEFSSKSVELMKKLKLKSSIKIFSFSSMIQYALKRSYFHTINPFAYCECGFDHDQISIQLSNVPLYNSDDEINDFVPSGVSGLSRAYLSKEFFSTWKKSRVKVLFEDCKNNSHHFYKYVDFDDIHLIRIDMYVYDPICLTKTDQKNLETVMNIQHDVNMKIFKREEYRREAIISLFKSRKIQKGLLYVAYAYGNYSTLLNKNDFFLHTNQIFTAYEACKFCLEDNKKKADKGFVYQIETGEGKSCIICLIASVLALMKKTVHITSSNISLSNRDYYESYDFFNKLGLSSAVLLHYNELPYVNFNNLPIDDTVYDEKYFPKKFFDKKLFKNSSRMNFSVCGIDNNNKKANIVFSTFVNFECLYLRMMELLPDHITQYFLNCSLIIDEADSILIDEIANGTILSRSIKTNGNEILKFVFQNRIQKKSVEETYCEIKNNWPKCNDLKIEDIRYMYQEIDLIHQDEFQNGRKYSIENIEIEEEKQKFKLFKKKNKKNFKQIVPFDYDHKGILEPNKEFSGFIQQFIAIKEINNSKDNANMIIKDFSMNYLYVSHPIFVKLYGGVCGLTGTIGNKYDKQIFQEQYGLSCMKVSRANPNYRVEFPIILCNDIQERNNKIVFEIISFHKKEFPVLVIFRDLNEINDIYKHLKSIGIKNINIFDGKDEKIKPDQIAGVKSAVSLGTNVCGRGTDIKKPMKPLHVIISYYTSNIRVIYQAFGRTARQGNEGSVRIICLKNQFVSPIEIFNKNEMNNILTDYEYKNYLQIEFIEYFKNKREWIFSHEIKAQKLNQEIIAKLRDAKININRINAFNFIYPICMSIPTFLDIQSQKIFSLYNCPNCKYTWILFQKYVREMILQSWSLFINQTEKNYFQLNLNISYQNYMKEEYKKMIDLLHIYLPVSPNVKDNDIVPTFMHIFDIVIKRYQAVVMNSFSNEVSQFFNQIGKKQFCSFSIGFKPYSLLDKSGSRINTLCGTEEDQNFIVDPELKYIQKMSNNNFSLLSITQKIDDIFNWICIKIYDVIGGYIGLKFFLRRTLGGCEFGVCYDFDLENIDVNLLNAENCIVDKDPLFLFTISVKSMVPILAGILIIGLVYIASISASIFEWISAFPVKITKKLIKKTMAEIASLLLQSQIEKLCDMICSFLAEKLSDQIKIIDQFKPEIAKIFKIILKFSTMKDFSKSGDMINQMFSRMNNFGIKAKVVQSFVQNNLPISHFLKIGLLLMLCFASFMFNFYHNQKSIKFDSEKVSAEYDENQNIEQEFDKNQNLIKKEKIEQPNFDFD